MKYTVKINWIVGAVLGLLVVSQGSVSTAKVFFPAVQLMAAQEQMGGAVMQTGSLSWQYGQAEEKLGRLIRDAGPNGAIDQPRLGKGIAEAARLKWQRGVAETSLGTAIAKNAVMMLIESPIQPGIDAG